MGYAARYFPPAEKARAEAMVRNLIAAFRQRIDQLDWMAPETKAKAKAKLADAEGRRGLPDHWSTTRRWTSARRCARQRAARRAVRDRRNLAKLGKPVDRGEWVDDAADRQRREPAGA